MEEVYSENKSYENSLYVTANMLEIQHYESKEDNSENSFVCEENKEESEENEEKEEENEEKGNDDEEIVRKSWLDMNLTDSATGLVLPFVSYEEPPEEHFEETIEKSKDQNGVSVKKAKLVQSGLMGLTSYYIYEVTTTVNERLYKVTRRFKDFEWLYKVLKDNYKGMSVPPLPSKNHIFHKSNSSETRRNQLEKVLEILLKHYIIKNSKQLHAFLTCEDSEFQKVKELMKPSPISFKYRDFEDAIDQIISKIQAKMNLIFSLRIMPFSQDLADIDRYLLYLQIPMYSLTSAFSMVLIYQQRANKVLEEMHFAHSNEFYRTMQLHKHLVSTNDGDLEKVTSHLTEENLKIEALRGAVNDYKSALRAYAELEALVERKLIKSRNSFDNVERYMDEIEKIKTDISELEDRVVKIENNIKNEKIWFQASRDEHFESVLDTILSLSTERLTKENSFWLEKKHEFL